MQPEDYPPMPRATAWVVAAAMLITGIAALHDDCNAQMTSEVHMRTIVAYNNASDQLMDEFDSLEGMWKRYATAQRIFARHHNREIQIVDIDDQDDGRVVMLASTANNANEQLRLLLFDLVDQLQKQERLTSILSQHIERVKPEQIPSNKIN